MSNIKMDKFYIYQPYGIKENNGFLWGVGVPADRPSETTIKGLTKDEAEKVVNLLNDHMFLVKTSKPSIVQQQLCGSAIVTPKLPSLEEIKNDLLLLKRVDHHRISEEWWRIEDVLNKLGNFV